MRDMRNMRGIRHTRSQESRLEHELLPHFFESYDPATRSYVPVQQLAYWYPYDLPADRPSSVDGVVSAMAALASMGRAENVDARGGPLLGACRSLLYFWSWL